MKKKKKKEMSNLTIYYNINKIYKKYFKLKNKNIKFTFTGITVYILDFLIIFIYKINKISIKKW